MKLLILISLFAVAFASIDDDAHTANTFEESLNTPESAFLDITINETSDRSPKAGKVETSSIRSGTKPTKETRTPKPPTVATTEAIVDLYDYIQPKNKFDEFDWQLSQKAFQNGIKDNVLLSPISVKILLTLLAETAKQDVESEMRTQLAAVLPYNRTLKASRTYFKNILNSLETPSSEFKVNIGSRMFAAEGVNAQQSFKSTIELFYKAKFESLNFSDAENSASYINDWVSRITNGKIACLVEEEALRSASMILINAIYFSGIWRMPFEQTIEKGFFVEPHTQVRKEFAEVSGEFYYYYSKNMGAKILRLPYAGNCFSMFVILPFEADGLEKLINNFNSSLLTAEVDRMQEISVHVLLPKFRFDTSTNFNQIVKDLGITEIFEDSATLSLLSGKQLKVSNIIQKAGIVVDEKGTEAYAATEIELIDKFGGDPRDFAATHPFMFYIEDDKTGAKLFTGIINNPEF